MSTTPRQKLSLDFDLLFPGEELTIGTSTIIIRPLTISQIATLSKKIKGMGKIISAEGVTWDNYTEKSSIFQLATVLIESFPEVLEEASNIQLSDLKQLPIECIVQIIAKVIDVNLKSKDDLTKNLQSLAEKLVSQLTPPVPQESLT